MTFKELAAQTGLIDNYMQDSAITYIFFSTSHNFTNEHLPFIELFRALMMKNPKNNTKDNQELLVLFQANYLLHIQEDEYAYRLLKQNRPYKQKALQALRYFSSLKDIPIFKDRAKLLEALDTKNFHLKEAQFEHKPSFLFDFYGNKRTLQ